ncbi:hypothetical protein AGMMS49949_00100 [Alphaproteobacteria bacterium]|nr:hypothetical protein AGMMS49949_00100 [Alphaproteobacteria bacterium]GHS95710.1 hypothetical protein AGMMS50296_0660 [Alphaproteobacteria bacterium]
MLMLKKNRILDYDAVLQKALRQVVRDILMDVVHQDLPEPHHFYITFVTDHPWVKMPEYLLKEYPTEMTIVLQYDFWDLEVEHDRFSVTLLFDDISERITVPFIALINFVDPSVKFGLQFEPIYETSEEARTPNETESGDGPKKKDTARTNVVSLDDFRKK